MLLCLILLVSSFFHLYRLGRGEFLGEDEAQVMIKVTREFLWRDDVRNLGAILTSSHPPMRMLLPLPLVGLFGASEFWLRLPNALAGIGVCYWTYRLGRRIFSRPVGVFAALLMAVSGMSGVYRSANGIGIFTLFLLVGLECLLVFVEARGKRGELSALTGAALFLGLAILTFLEGGIFVLPAAYKYLRKVRRVERTAILPIVVYALLAGSYVVLWTLVPILAARWGLLPQIPAGNVQHLVQRLRALGAFNVDDWLGSTAGTNSIWLTLFLAATIPWGWRHWGRKGQTAILFFAPHLLVWLFLFQNPCGHTTYELPLWAILSAQGAQILWSKVGARLRWARSPLGLVTCAVVLLTGWHTYVLFLQDGITPSVSNLVFYQEQWMGTPCGVPRFVQLGQPAAGVYIRQHAGLEDMILSNFGGSLEIYYAGRVSNPLRLDDVASELDEPTRMQELNTHYLVLGGAEPVGPTGGMRPACIISERGEASLLIYDLWDEPGTTEIVNAKELRPVFYAEYATWQNLRPFLTADSGEHAP
jgi:4-amino-4-deoxy-L-arabinose transferase-like glycosyltransferase